MYQLIENLCLKAGCQPSTGNLGEGMQGVSLESIQRTEHQQAGHWVNAGNVGIALKLKHPFYGTFLEISFLPALQLNFILNMKQNFRHLCNRHPSSAQDCKWNQWCL